MNDKWLLILLALGLNAGCQADLAESEQSAVSPKAADIANNRALKGGQADAGANDKIDSDPVPTQTAIIVSKTDITVEGKPACDFVIRYPDTIDQNVTWNGEGCKTVATRFLTADDLKSFGQFDDLGEEAKEDILRNPGKRTFYIESEFTASAFPLNVAGVIYEVPVAD
jgi:hypothetical protein